MKTIILIALVAVSVYTVSANAAVDVDKFGVKKLYPTKYAREWYLSDGIDKRFNPQTILKKNTDGSYKVKDTTARLEVYTTSTYRAENIVTNQAELAKRGYMMATNDWRNVEMTGYFKVNSYSKMDDIVLYARGGKHGTNECEGTSYKGGLFFDGRGRWVKELEHTDGYVFGTMSTSTIGDIKGKWVGLKAVIYNTGDKVRLELYTNTNGDKVTWNKITTRYDSGTWRDDKGHCGGTSGQMITWGGPIATFRWDSTNDVDFRDLSVREIVVPR